MLLKTCACLLCCVTMALDMCLDNGVYLVKQEPKMLLLNPGETAIINCTVIPGDKTKNINFRKRFKVIMNIVVNSNPSHDTVEHEYDNRLKYSGQLPYFTLMLKNVTHDDSDFYICDGIIENNKEILGEGTLIFVGKQEVTKKKNETEEPNVNQTSKSPNNRVHLYIIIGITTALLLLIAVFGFIRYFKMEKKNINQNTYVDMTQTLRRNTMQNNNVYCRQ